MPSAVAGPEIERLIQLLARLPGLGPRSARRAALHLIKKREALMTPLAGALQVAIDKIQVCKTCGNIDTQNPCTVCTDPRRDPAIIVVVADVADLWALERAHATNGFYHVLGATLSPLDGVGPQDLTIDALVARAHDPRVTEIILALNATVDGQTTAHYITDLLQEAGVKVTTARPRRAGRRRTRLSRRRHAVCRHAAADAVLISTNGNDRHDETTIRQTFGFRGSHCGDVLPRLPAWRSRPSAPKPGK